MKSNDKKTLNLYKFLTYKKTMTSLYEMIQQPFSIP